MEKSYLFKKFLLTVCTWRHKSALCGVQSCLAEAWAVCIGNSCE